MKAAMVALVMMAAAMICLVPSDVEGSVYHDITTESNVIGTGDDAEFDIVYNNTDYDGYDNMNMSVSYTASLVDSNGNTVSSGVSPSSGDLDLGVAETLTVSAPDDAGTYRLIVEYEVSVTYTETDDEGETEEVTVELDAVQDTYTIYVVEPITLSVVLTNGSELDLSSYGVYFVIDGERIDDSYQTITIATEGQVTVTYEWITLASSGEHTFYLEADDEGNIVEIEGLGEVHTFYIGDNSYTWLVVLLVVVIILLLVVMAWVYRKPVKNYGKPKSRR